MSPRIPLVVLFLAGFVGLPGPEARADVKLHGLFSDNMVLQQGVNCPIWGTADPGEEVAATIAIGGKDIGPAKPVRADKDGKWLLLLPQLKAGGPFTLTIKGKNSITLKNVLAGEVWVCSGQSNMARPVKLNADPEKVIAESKNDMIRLYTVPRGPAPMPQSDVKASWQMCNADTVPGFSAVAYHFGRHLQRDLNVPIGLISTNVGGTAAERWTSMAVLDKLPESKGKDKGEAGLYNAMIAPLTRFPIKGAIWYQGESNASRHDQYEALLSAMIKNWRDDWKQGDFPFFIVQLAPFMKIDKEPADTPWARLREAQRQVSLKVPNTALAVITDVGDEKDIHPKQKGPVGDRLALAALALTYGKKIEHSGPVFERMMVEGSKAVLSFKHTGGGLVAKGGPLTGFTIAGEDKKFHNAEAVIQDGQVIVSSKQVAKPAAVRFGWANYPVVNLWNKAGQPASPFRTDDWPMAAPLPKK